MHWVLFQWSWLETFIINGSTNGLSQKPSSFSGISITEINEVLEHVVLSRKNRIGNYSLIQDKDKIRIMNIIQMWGACINMTMFARKYRSRPKKLSLL